MRHEIVICLYNPCWNDECVCNLVSLPTGVRQWNLIKIQVFHVFHPMSTQTIKCDLNIPQCVWLVWSGLSGGTWSRARVVESLSLSATPAGRRDSFDCRRHHWLGPLEIHPIPKMFFFPPTFRGWTLIRNCTQWKRNCQSKSQLLWAITSAQSSP